MNRLKTRSKVLDKLFNDLSLKYKILIVIFSGFFILFLSGLATMAFTSRSYEKRLYQSIAASMTYAASDISSQLQSVDSIIDSILASQVIQTNLEEMKELEQGSQRQIYNTRIYNELSGYLFAFQNDSISYMSIIQDQEIISTSLSSFMEVPYQLRSSLIARAQSREGATTVVPDFGSQYGIFIVKELRKIDKLSLEPLGVLIISLNPAALTETAVSSHSDYDDMSCLLFDGDALIYNGSTLSDRQAVELSKDLSGDYGIEKAGKETLFAVRGKIPLYDWDYISTVSYSSVYKTVTLSGRLFLLIMVAALAVVSYLAVKVILAIFYRFDRLMENMKSFGEGNYQVPEAPRKYQEDEIGLLYKNFDSMVEKIQTLIQENYVNEILKKEAQLKAMESQMDPHFLYNTLESINWRAKMIKSEEISQITTALGSLLRFSLGKNSEDFTLDQEMQIVNNYITIQKIRYQRRLDFSADVPSDLLGVFIPKFTIQPLLENAIRYGLEESSETCYISIVCREVLGLLIIRITNTGSSFEENCMEKLQSGEIQPHGFGIGILNIHRRLQLTYGEPYGLLLYNIEDEEMICQAIANIIDWEKYDIRLIGTCTDGVDAYHTILDECPDIVMTDIRMPGISGLELIERISRTDLNTQFIILSGYGEFDYAKRAMKCGVRHYLLKPCTEEQIIDCIQDVTRDYYQAVSERDSEKGPNGALLKDLHKTLIQNMIREGVSLISLSDSFFESYEHYLDLTNVPYQFCCVYYLEEKNLDLCLKEFHTFRQESMPDTEVYLIYIKNILLFFFTNGESSYEELDAYFQSVSFPGETVSVDYQRQKYPDLKSLLTMLIKRIKRYDIMYFIEGTGKVPTFNYGQIVEKINHLVPLLSAGNSEERESSLRELKSILTSVSNKDFLLQLADNIIISLGTHLPSGILPEITDFLYNLHKEENMAQIPVLVLDYIQEHYKNPDLTLKWISENYLYMNVSYVSRCFTKETGEKFSGFLMNLRVQKAKEILASSGGEKIQDVAELVGCGNTPYYFSKIFKKCTGLTPSAYVKKNFRP